MKKLILILYLLPAMLINAQVIDWNNFKEMTMNEVTFRILNEYISLDDDYSLSYSSEEHRKIDKCIKKNNDELLLDDLSARINEIIPVSSVGILDSISVKEIKTYEEVANRCIKDWIDFPSDAFFLVGWGKKVELTSFYNKRTKTVYISVVFKS